MSRRLLLVSLLAVVAAAAEERAPYVPTPPAVVDRLLALSGLKAGERLYDLGSGDGRIVVRAAEAFRAEATGVEIDPGLVRRSRDLIRRRRLEARARIVEGDLFAQDYGQADVVAAYLLPSVLERLRPLLERQLRPGTRVVTHDFEVPGWTPERTETIEDDGQGRSRTLFLYRR